MGRPGKKQQLSLFASATSEAPQPLQTLAGLEREVLLCKKCRLRATCRQVVFGEGSPKARLMLVGEGPGATEDELGRPFVGAAGRLLDRILAAVDWTREELYITNVVKCRPPGNRLPAPDEVAACLCHLEDQIRLIDPLIIVCLGVLATQTLVAANARITRERGQWKKRGQRMVMPTFHPAALLRDASKKRPVWDDFREIRRVYDRLVAAGS
ncbi:MAG: uracil-DNA glycosylase [Bacillota bacterium]